MLSTNKILVVDDNVDAADMTAEVLRMNGLTVRVAYSGAEAMATARSFAPSVIFLDIGMPIMDGCEVARALRAEEAFRGVRIVALTAWGDQESVRMTQAAGFDSHLTKPARIETLVELAQ